MRGRGRRYDELGQCGKQKLVVAAETKTFLANAHRLFPGALIAVKGSSTKTGKTTTADTLIRILSKPELSSRLSAADMGRLIGRPWRDVASNVMTPEFVAALGAMGWQYITGRGRAGAHFERITDQLKAA